MIALLVLILALLTSPAQAAAPDLSVLAYDQRPGSPVPLNTIFQDAQGETVTLREAIGRRPTILALGYFHCPNLCGLVRQDLMNALSRLNDDRRVYSLVVLSIDPAETQADAGAARTADEDGFDHPNETSDWHYLTGSAAAIQAVSQAVGFRSRFDAREQFLHPAGIVFLTSAGTVSSYLLGLGYQPSDVGLGLTRAANGVTARALPVLLLCFHYDPATGRYTLAILRVLQLAAGITVLVVGGTILLAARRGRQPP